MDDKAKTIPALHIDTQLLIQRLEKLAIGETLSYDALAAIIGQSVRNGTQGYIRLTKAREVLEKDPDKRMVFAAIAGVGIQRLNDSEITTAGAAYVGRVRRVTRRGLRKLACVNFDGLSNGDRLKHNTAASHLGVLAELASRPAEKRIAKQVEKNQEKLAVAKTLSFFAGKE